MTAIEILTEIKGEIRLIRDDVADLRDISARSKARLSSIEQSLAAITEGSAPDDRDHQPHGGDARRHV
jgi:hypothetical protein